MGFAFSVSAQEQGEDPQSEYFKTLASLCGDRFEGLMTYPNNDQSDFAGKLLVATFEGCSESEIRVPFQVGDDTSRTWIFTKSSKSIELKHDHRHVDGSADEISNYGGRSLSDGTALAQAFHADEFTQQLIPEAATNVWNVSFDVKKNQLTYHLERHDKPSFTAVLTRVAIGASEKPAASID